MIFFCVGDDAGNAWKFQRFIRLQRRPTTRRDNVIHARASDLADLAARNGDGVARHRAGVDDCHLSQFSRRDDLMPCRAESTRHIFDLRLVEPASDGIEVDLHDFSVIASGASAP